MMKMIFAFALLLSALVPALAEQQFKTRVVSDPQTFDWNLAHTDMETPIVMNIMEGLVEFDERMKPKPALAKSWTVSQDQLTYTFKLKTDVKWSDGKQLSAEDFVYSWRRLLDPATAAPYSNLLFDVAGAEDFNARRTTDFAKVGVRAIDSSTLEVKLRRPVSYFIQILTFWITFPVRKDVVEKYGTGWSKPGKIVVLGPFIPVAYQPQSQILLKRNPLYHGRPPEAESVLIRIVNEDSTALNLFREGQIDFVRPINYLEMGALTQSPSFHEDEYLRLCYLSINTAKYPMNLPKVRQAFAQAVNQEMIPKILHRKVEPARSLVPESLLKGTKDMGYAMNVETAKTSLQATGLSASALPALDFVTFSSDDNALLSQFLQSQMKTNLGLNLQIQMPEYKTYRTQLELGSAPIYFRCWGADYADPDSFFGLFTSDSGNNRTNWKNAQYDKLVKEAAGMPAGAERANRYKAAMQILLKDEAVIVPLYFDTLTYLLNPRIKGFKINSLNYAFFRDILFVK